jgi:cardiolipin synthase
VIPFNPFLSFGAQFHLWLFRNHKKILVIDQDVAFTGGMNIGDQYAGPAVGGNGYPFLVK